MKKVAKEIVREGQYVFENNTSGDLSLPRPTIDGLKMVRKNGRFIGDKYYMQMVPQELKYIREVEASTERLITEQPPVVTHLGQVEFVEQKIESKKDEEVLLTESPIAGLQIIR